MSAAPMIRALQARKVGSGWMAKCPAHEDRNPSLSIREVDGKVLLHCHAGCSQRDVIAALQSRGLWEAGDSQEWREWHDGIRYRVEWGTPVQEYKYTDREGSHLYSVVRFEPKDFKPGYREAGRWIWKKHPRQVLYRLPEVTEAPIVFVVEGERDVETLREWGFVATTNAGGAAAPWLPEFTDALRGREVILIPDRDRVGRARVLRIARALVGQAAKLIILDLEHTGKDVSDWFAAGHSEVELIAQVEGPGVAQ